MEESVDAELLLIEWNSDLLRRIGVPFFFVADDIFLSDWCCFVALFNASETSYEALRGLCSQPPRFFSSLRDCERKAFNSWSIRKQLLIYIWTTYSRKEILLFITQVRNVSKKVKVAQEEYNYVCKKPRYLRNKILIRVCAFKNSLFLGRFISLR